MNKQQFVAHLIHDFKLYASDPPVELSALVEEIEQKLSSYTLEQLEEDASRVETNPSGDLNYQPDDLYNLLYKAYPFMYELAKEENRYELWQVVNQLRGELGMATDLPPDLV